MTDQPDQHPPDDPGTEAAKYRRRLRAVEAERDTLSARVRAVQAQQVRMLLAAYRITEDALWTATDLDGLLDPEGNVDPDKVAQAAETARETLGIETVPGLFVPQEGTIPAPPRRNGFTAAFAPERTR